MWRELVFVSVVFIVGSCTAKTDDVPVKDRDQSVVPCSSEWDAVQQIRRREQIGKDLSNWGMSSIDMVMDVTDDILGVVCIERERDKIVKLCRALQKKGNILRASISDIFLPFHTIAIGS